MLHYLVKEATGFSLEYLVQYRYIRLGQIFEITHPFIIAGWFRLSIGHKGIKIEHICLMKLIPVLGTYWLVSLIVCYCPTDLQKSFHYYVRFYLLVIILCGLIGPSRLYHMV